VNKISVFKKDFFSVGTLKFINLFFKLLNSVLFVQLLSLDGRGEYFKFIQISGVCGFFICLSIGDYLLYQVNQKKQEKGFVDFFKFYLYTFLLLYFLSFLFLSSYNRIWLLFIISGSLEYLILSFFKSNRDYHLVSRFIFLKNIFIILTLIFFSSKIKLLDFFYFINYLNIFLILIFATIHNLLIGNFLNGIKKFHELYEYAKYVHFNNIFNDIENKADILIISFFLSDKQIGIYSIIVVLAQSINHVTNFLVQLISPNLKHVSKDNFINVIQLTFIFGATYFLFVIVTGKSILSYLYLIDDVTIYYLTLVLLIGVVFENITKVYLTYFKFSENYSVVSKIAIYTACFNVVFNLIFIPSYGILGAVIVSLITYSVRFVYFHLKYIKFERIANSFFILPNRKQLLLVLKRFYKQTQK